MPVAGVFALILFGQFVPRTGIVRVSIEAVGERGRPVKLSVTDMLTRESTVIAETYVDARGKASLDFSVSNEMFVGWEIGNYGGKLLVSPGDELVITVNGEKSSTPFHYAGRGAEASIHLAQIADVWRTYEKKGNLPLTSLTQQAFLSRLDSVQNSYIEVEKRFNLAKPLRTLVSERNRLQLLGYRINYAMAKFNPNDTTGNSLKELKDLTAQIPLEASLLEARAPEYAMVLLFFLQIEAQWPLVLGKKREEVIALRNKLPVLADSLILAQAYPPKIQSYLRAKNIETLLTRQGISPVADTLITSLKRDPDFAPYASSIAKKYEKWQAIGNGQPAPDFSGVTPEGKLISLKDLRGKVVYLDVWATWCRPCIEEFPYAIKLQEAFEGNDQVAFLYVSVDTNQAAWKRRMKEKKELGGIHLNLPVAEKGKSFWDTYQLHSIPRYVLIDKAGILININAPGPSSGYVQAEIQKLLE